MNLMEESFQKKEEKNNKTALTIILIAIIVLVIAIISIFSYIIYIQNNTLKLTLDGVTNEGLKELLIIKEDGTVYAPIKEIASYLGYDSYNGEYTDKSENKSKCYVQSKDGNEVANFNLNSNKVYKLDLTSSTNNYEYVYSDKPVIANNGELYATSEMIEKAFNVSFNYDKDGKKITIYTMSYLIEYYSNAILDYGYTEISDVFTNQKTVLNDMLVVKKDNKFAVIDVKGNVILEPKYDNITYLTGAEDFLVENNKKVGIISKNKETKIQIMYDSIELMDSDSQLYVVENENKYGVLDFKGNIKIHVENDEIGMDVSKFEKNDIKSEYILAENLIPAKRDNLWGLYDKNGNLVVDFYYDNFGYVASTKTVLNLLVIPDYNVLVACKDKKYTLLSSEGEELFAAPVADDIYMTITENTKNYYITVNNQTMDATEYLEKIGVKSKKTSKDTENSKTNTSTNAINSTNNQSTSEKNTVTNSSTSEDYQAVENEENEEY